MVARRMLGDLGSGYIEFVGPGNASIRGCDRSAGESTSKTPQMPSYHLKRADGQGITLVNIGVWPPLTPRPRQTISR